MAGAYELRHGMPSGASPKSVTPDMIQAMSTGLWLDFLGVRLDSNKADPIRAVIQLITPDNGEQYTIEISHGTLTNIEEFLADNADLTITINRFLPGSRRCVGEGCGPNTAQAPAQPRQGSVRQTIPRAPPSPPPLGAQARGAWPG